MTMYRGAPYSDDALALSRQLGLDDWIRRLPLGYETKVGDQLFLLLPDGIHQRICLVRALVNRPKVLVLDEANTSLDEDGDRLLRQVILSLRGKMTIVFVTHRPSIQELADASFELIDGALLPKKMLSLPTGTISPEKESQSIVQDVAFKEGDQADTKTQQEFEAEPQSDPKLDRESTFEPQLKAQPKTSKNKKGMARKKGKGAKASAEKRTMKALPPPNSDAKGTDHDKII